MSFPILRSAVKAADGVCRSVRGGCHAFDGEKHTLNREGCVGCGLCTDTHCGCLEIFGYEMSAKEVVAKVLEDKDFYEPDGGMTLSGGEPLTQADFSAEILKLAKENGIHTAMETCGFAAKEVIEKTAEYTDLYLFDCKETHPALHKKFTGVDNSVILENLRLLDSLGKKIILRCPIIPGCNARIDHLAGIGKLATQLKNLEKIELEPYHSFGEQKYSNLGLLYSVNSHTPSGEDMEKWKSEISKYTDVSVAIN